MSSDPFKQMAALMLAQGWPDGPMAAALGIAIGDDPQARAMTLAALDRWSLPYPPGEAALAGILRDLHLFRLRGFPAIAAPAINNPPVWAATLGLPAFGTPVALADWLDLDLSELQWLADCDGRLARSTEKQGHYSPLWLRKKNGLRLVEAPLPRLKAVQRRLLRDLLAKIPLHPDSFGFVPGRDCRGHASRHAGEQVVICLDLCDFFPSIRASRLHAIFRSIGYSPSVARLLTGLVTTRTAPDVAAALAVADRARWQAPHLPQGAPTSPALANLAARRLDLRLSAFARRMGASYSRYADDLALSGPRELTFEGGRPLLEMAAEIVRDEGFRLNDAKTRIQRQGARQKVTGMVVNRHINLARSDFDRLKAILTNCVRQGPAMQNRDQQPDFRAYLTGRVGWAEQVNPRRGVRLRRLLDQIDWAG